MLKFTIPTITESTEPKMIKKSFIPNCPTYQQFDDLVSQNMEC